MVLVANLVITEEQLSDFLRPYYKSGLYSSTSFAG
jgi:hypothetical protein